MVNMSVVLMQKVLKYCKEKFSLMLQLINDHDADLFKNLVYTWSIRSVHSKRSFSRSA